MLSFLVQQKVQQHHHQRSAVTVGGQSSSTTSTLMSAAASASASYSSSTGRQRQPRPLPFASIAGGKKIVSAGSKKNKRSAAGVRDDGDATMNAMLLFMANERKFEMEARRQELQAAGQARREENAIRREELKSMNLFMMQMISQQQQQWNHRNNDIGIYNDEPVSAFAFVLLCFS